MSGEKQKSQSRRIMFFLEEFSESVLVALGFRHFLAVYDEMTAVKPVIHEFFPAVSFGLGNFILMVRKNVIHSSAMNVKGLA